MGVERVEAIARALVEHGKPADTPVAVVQEGTTAAQRRVDATLCTVARRVAEEGVRPPAVIVIGEVVAVGGAVAELARAAVAHVPEAGPSAPEAGPSVPEAAAAATGASGASGTDVEGGLRG